MNEASDRIRVLIVDDHQMVRQGLRLFLASKPDILVVDEAADGMQALGKIRNEKPDVVLLDLKMPGIDGIEVISQIKKNNDKTEVLVLTSYIDDNKVLTAIQNGAIGYLMKDVNPDELVSAIRKAANGEIYMHKDAVKSLARGIFHSDEKQITDNLLTKRELDVVKLVTRGMSNDEIAEKLDISTNTVKTHVSNVLTKLKLESRVQLAIYALQNNLVLLDDI